MNNIFVNIGVVLLILIVVTSLVACQQCKKPKDIDKVDENASNNNAADDATATHSASTDTK